MPKIQTLCAHCSTANRVDETRLGDTPKCGKCGSPLFSGAPTSVSDVQFTRWVEREQLPLVIDFWASWCGPCQSFAPGFARAAATLEPMARFIKVNTEHCPQASARFSIRSIPTLMVMRGGEVIAHQAGALPYPEFLQWLNGTLNY